MIKRDFYLNKLIESKENGQVKIITGIRRCGKSFLLFEIYKRYLLEQGVDEDHIIKFSLDGIKNEQLRDPRVLYHEIEKLIIDAKQYYLFIDEIQFVEEVKNTNPDLSRPITFVDVVLQLVQINNLDIYITGSNSYMLSKNILTQFRGKNTQIKVHPLSYKELADHFGNSEELLTTFLKYGGMPFLYAKPLTDEAKEEYLLNLFKETYLIDIIERNRIYNDENTLKIILDIVSHSVGSIINPNKIANRFLSIQHKKISSETIEKYLTNFEDAYLISRIQRVNIHTSEYFKTSFKCYYEDVGLRNARLKFQSSDFGFMMENVVYNELTKQGFNTKIGIVIHDEKVNNSITRKQLEVDFISEKSNIKYYIQSALRIDDADIKNRETKSLYHIKDSFGKIVIVKDYIKSFYDEKGVFYISLKDFLLSENLSDIASN